MTTTILWIEGSRHPNPSFVPGLRNKGYLVSTVPTGKKALLLATKRIPNLTVVNAVSFGTSGARICSSLRSQMKGQPILLIGGKGKAIQSEYANQVLILPFTIRKLINRIKDLVPEKNTEVLQVGLLALYPELRMVRCKDGELSRLTPIEVSLLKMLMERSGEVIDRKQLFREAWETDYVDDTRTLDVHISWLRKKIEEDHRKPELLKTIRGVGYLLDV